MDDISRQRIATRIHDLVLLEWGEDIDVALMLGPPEYARAVLSLCRSGGNSELARLAEQFLRASDEEFQRQRIRQVTRYGDAPERGPAPPRSSPGLR